MVICVAIFDCRILRPQYDARLTLHERRTLRAGCG